MNVPGRQTLDPKKTWVLGFTFWLLNQQRKKKFEIQKFAGSKKYKKIFKKFFLISFKIFLVSRSSFCFDFELKSIE